jgi:hypothetical protein
VVVASLAGCAGPPTGPAAGPLLRLGPGGDGDSFTASDGVEYRIGMVNTPELSECGGHDAADRTRALLADGFTAEVYQRDDHGRQVARVTAAGQDVGVLLAREGWADDRYLEGFRHEHPAYAAELDAAFAEARRRGTGLWSTCWSGVQLGLVPPPPRAVAAPGGRSGPVGAGPCHPAYRQCLPLGRDLDCADIGHRVDLLGRADPYRLDGRTAERSDGVGCDTYPPPEPSAPPPGGDRGS